MRKVIVYALESGKKVENGKGQASFHGWGVDYEEFDTGPGNFSTAIVEYSDGSIETVPADDIKFCEGI